jgi:hypothetical protein
MKHTIKPILLLLLLSSCVSFREGNKIKLNTAEKRLNKSITIIVSGDIIVNGIDRSTDEKKYSPWDKTWKNSVNKAYIDFGLFSSVSVLTNNNTVKDIISTDFICDVYVSNKVDGSLLSWISLFTLFIVPYREQATIEITTSIKDKKGMLLKKYKKSEKVIQWWQLLLIFAPFFTEMDETEGTPQMYKQIYYELNLNSIQEAMNDRIFK